MADVPDRVWLTSAVAEFHNREHARMVGNEPMCYEYRRVHTCVWQQVDEPEHEVWQTGCGNLWQFTVEGGPPEHNMEFCPYSGCGGRIEVNK